MKKVILVDGNNLMFRSFYATLYSGSIMKNSKGFPTNALYGFVTMINKIIEEEKPNYMAVAFDIGKNFRHEKYDNYKAGRSETPIELKQQMTVARDILDALGIKYFEKEMYEADDIIGTFVEKALADPEFAITIISSDKDLLQLINYETDVKLLKQKGFIRYTEESFKNEYGFDPIKIIDLKALQGDASDNIPGIKGIGEKTAINLIQKYGSLDGIYEHLDEIKGSLHEKLSNGKESAYFSYEIATIFREVPIDINFEDIKYSGPDTTKMTKIFEELEFYSLLKKTFKKEETIKIDYQIISSLDEINITKDFAFYLECDAINYHDAHVLGMSIYDGNKLYFINKDLIKDFFLKYKEYAKWTYDLKKVLYLLKKEKIELNATYDLMIILYLLNYNSKEDLAYQMANENINIPFYDVLLKNKFANLEELMTECSLKAKYIYETKERYLTELKEQNMEDLYFEIELPLITVLTDMEWAGVWVKREVLEEQQESIKTKLDEISREIYDLAGEEFNISSYRQLGVILFEKLGLKSSKKNPTGYKTDVNVLHKLIDKHPIIPKVIEYRNLTKLNNTYLDGFYKYIVDEKIHTIYKQNLTRTGRLSSIEPNLQNIPIKEEEGKKIRKAFFPSANSVLISADYSQIELRILAHISGDETLIKAFREDKDIHTTVASDIFGVKEEEVTKLMRKSAKAVIFGIVYGISGFGLGENLSISPTEAKKFINKYYELYPKVRSYMTKIVKDAKEKGYVRTLFNRKRNIEELKSNNFVVRRAGERIALNTPIQGTSADIIKKAMVAIYNEFKKENIQSKMILQVHDELIFDTLKDEEEKVLKIVKEQMEKIVTLSVPLKVGIEKGDNWYEAK